MYLGSSSFPVANRAGSSLGEIDRGGRPRRRRGQRQRGRKFALSSGKRIMAREMRSINHPNYESAWGFSQLAFRGDPRAKTNTPARQHRWVRFPEEIDPRVALRVGGRWIFVSRGDYERRYVRPREVERIATLLFRRGRCGGPDTSAEVGLPPVPQGRRSDERRIADVHKRWNEGNGSRRGAGGHLYI